MTAPLSQDLRDRVIQSIRGGLSCRATARRFGIAPATAIRRHKRYIETGSTKPSKQGGYRGRHRIEPYAPLILGWTEEQRDITLAELQAKLKAEHNGDFAISTRWNLLHRHAITVKKTAHAAEQARAAILIKRRAGFDAQKRLDPKRLFFIDETGADTKMARTRGRAKRGTRCCAVVPHGHWKTTPFTVTLTHRAYTAPMRLDGPMNGRIFLAYVRTFLAPELKPGDHVILDNLSAHKVCGVREAIEATGAQLLYLPPYSPDFNPIERAFSKLKALLRKAAARTIEALWDVIAQAITQFHPVECRNFFTSCGYIIDPV